MGKAFGIELEAARAKAGVSLTALARKLEVSVAYLSEVERGNRPALLPWRIRRACEALGCPDASPRLEMLAADEMLHRPGRYRMDGDSRAAVEGILGAAVVWEPDDGGTP